jgi:hypothetical protein
MGAKTAGERRREAERRRGGTLSSAARVSLASPSPLPRPTLASPTLLPLNPRLGFPPLFLSSRGPPAKSSSVTPLDSFYLVSKLSRPPLPSRPCRFDLQKFGFKVAGVVPFCSELRVSLFLYIVRRIVRRRRRTKVTNWP